MDQTVASEFEVYLKRADLRPASKRFKRQALKHFIKEFGDMPVTAVSRAVAEDYRVILAKGRSKRAANGYLANFRPFWKWLHKHGTISENPFADLHAFRITESERQTFTTAELSRLVRTASRLWRMRICLGLLGMRRGEVLNLCVRDINQSGPDSHILLTPKSTSPTTWEWGLKDHTQRMVALPERMCFAEYVVELHQDLVRLQEDLPVEQPYLLLEPKYYRKLIEWQRQKKLTDEDTADPTGNFQRAFRRLQRDALVRPFRRFHELRAAFATAMIKSQGIDRAADALGHSSVDTTRKYDRRNQQEMVADIGRLASTFYET